MRNTKLKLSIFILLLVIGQMLFAGYAFADEEYDVPGCPECGSENVIFIVYGYPGMELMQAAEKGGVRLGGCIIMDDSPNWYCTDCENSFK